MVPENGRTFYSFKFKKSGLRYEIYLCIKTGEIVWINGPYECGIWNNLQIFRNSLMSHLEPGERVEADDGYIGEHPQHIKCPRGFANDPECIYMQQRIRNRQETVNKRFKNWGILKQVFRGNIPDHGDAVHAVGVITQISIMGGEKLFSCGYRNPPYITEDGNGNGDGDEDDNDDEGDDEGLSYDETEDSL